MTTDSSAIIGRVFISGDPNPKSDNVEWLARAAEVVQKAKRDRPDQPVIAMTPGDNTGTHPAAYELVRLFADVTTFGNNDGKLPDIQAKVKADPCFNLVAANLSLTPGNLKLAEGLLPPPFSMYEFSDTFGGVRRVAVMGLANPKADTYRRANLEDQGIAVTDPRETVMRCIPEIQKEKPDAIFILYHNGSGKGKDFPGDAWNVFSNLEKNSCYVETPTVVVTGHFNPPPSNPETVPGNNDNVTMLQGGYEMSFLWEIELRRDFNGKIFFSSPRHIPITEDMPLHPEAARIIEDEKQKSGIMGFAKEPYDWTFQRKPIPGWNREETGFHPSETSFGKQVTSLFLDEARKKVPETQFCLWDERFFRAGLPAGDVYNLQFGDAVPNDDKLVVTQMKVGDLMTLFHELYSTENLRFRAEYPDPPMLAGGKAKVNYTFSKDNPEARLDSLELGGKLLVRNGEVVEGIDLNETMTLATRKTFLTNSCRHYKSLLGLDYTVVSDSVRNLFRTHLGTGYESS